MSITNKIHLGANKTQKALPVIWEMRLTVRLSDFTEVNSDGNRSLWPNFIFWACFPFPSRVSGKTKLSLSLGKPKPSSWESLFSPACVWIAVPLVISSPLAPFLFPRAPHKNHSEKSGCLWLFLGVQGMYDIFVAVWYLTQHISLGPGRCLSSHCYVTMYPLTSLASPSTKLFCGSWICLKICLFRLQSMVFRDPWSQAIL